MEWTPEVTGGFVTIFGGLIAAFTLIIKNMGARADPEIIKIIKTMQENESKRDEVQAEQARSQAESLKSLVASQESQAKSMEYLGQMQQGSMNAITTAIEQLKPIAPMVTAIQTIQDQNSELSGNVEQMSKSQEQLLKEIIKRLDGVQKTLDEMNPRLKETEQEVAIIRGQVLEIQKVATQEQEMPGLNMTPTPEPVAGAASISSYVWDVGEGEIITGGAVGTDIDVEFPEPEEKPDGNTDNQTT